MCAGSSFYRFVVSMKFDSRVINHRKNGAIHFRWIVVYIEISSVFRFEFFGFSSAESLFEES